jgi:hypothetical protein
MGATFPAKQNMATASADPQASLDFAMRYYGAKPDDIRITASEPARSWERGIKTHYTLEWRTYVGWKVYMFLSGCMASDPRYEPAEV